MPLGFVQPEMGEHPVVNHAQSFQQTKTVVFFLYCFLLFSLPPIIFSLHPFNLSLHPPTFLYLPHSDPTGVRSSSLLFRYRHPFGLYERTLQPTHTAYPPTPPPPHPPPPANWTLCGLPWCSGEDLQENHPPHWYHLLHARRTWTTKQLREYEQHKQEARRWLTRRCN